MTPINPNYHTRLYARAEELVNSEAIHQLLKSSVMWGKTPKEVDIEVLFSLIHEGYRQRCLEEKFWEDSAWDYEI
jgi:hypothetical protein